MTKVRTVIPPNAKPGTSVIQVKHPKTGKPTRVQVPKTAVPGQMVELDLPDPVDSVPKENSRSGYSNPSGMKLSDYGASDHRSDSVSTASGSTPSVSYGSFGPVVVVPQPTQVPSPLPFGTGESHGSETAKGVAENEPLISKPVNDTRGWWARFANPCGLCGCLFD